jgi:hypothetical protein
MKAQNAKTSRRDDAEIARLQEVLRKREARVEDARRKLAAARVRAERRAA